ncbi:hypothetical protein H7A76_27850 [Pseudomonas sp. MSSRFD41]|uniref:hypothetical protein n=1 Tax=Pseudomonas sp. MSSRFD41 TaxID=1310370 RepID=UPI00163A14A0|nr:hypothetical protein [Pseudomonas sp. MSSRFD41]MBC2659271.1 hypothetical protein [Pseudomonas sp. MSSRFD41]
MKNNLAVAFLFFAMALQGCGSSVLIKQEAANSVVAGKTATEEVKKYYDTVFDRQTEFAASLLARHPECKYGDYIVIRRYYGEKKSLCLSELEVHQWQSDKSIGFRVYMAPLERSSLQLSMDILDAFSVYLEALSKYTSSPDTPIAGALEEAIVELKAVDEKVKLLPKGADSILSQSTAVTDLIAYFEKLKNNSRDAREIRKIVETDGAKQEANLLAIAAEVDRVNMYYVSSMSSTLTSVLGDYYNRNVNSKEFGSVEKRQSFLSALFRQKQLDSRLQMSSSPGAIAIRKFVAAHVKLRNAISGNYSEEQRAFLVDENTKELKDGLERLASLVQFAMSLAL